MRVLNIVVDECRILSSRERCPYLVQLEVAETGLRGNDGRLYASGVQGLGATVEEALAMSASAASKSAASGKHHSLEQSFASYHIPPELLATSISPRSKIDVSEEFEAANLEAGFSNLNASMPRGGWQSDEAIYYPQHPDDLYSTPYGMVRQSELERLHRQMYSEESSLRAPAPAVISETR